MADAGAGKSGPGPVESVSPLHEGGGCYGERITLPWRHGETLGKRSVEDRMMHATDYGPTTPFSAPESKNEYCYIFDPWVINT